MSQLRNDVGPAERGHRDLPSEMIRREDGQLRFRPRCSCGWTGEPVDQSRVMVLFDAHARSLRGGSTD